LSWHSCSTADDEAREAYTLLCLALAQPLSLYEQLVITLRLLVILRGK
jgi:hypothetical protein